LVRLRRQGYPAFAASALEERRQAALPPFSHQALMRAESPDQDAARSLLRRAAQEATDLTGTEVTIFGPVPAPMERRGGRYRSHLLVQSDSRPALKAFLTAWLAKVRGLRGASHVRWSLDVDPQEML
jgi:primosomal protein N' (replication factor Y)